MWYRLGPITVALARAMYLVDIAVGELLTAVQKYIDDPRTELPDDQRLLANLGVLGVALLSRR